MPPNPDIKTPPGEDTDTLMSAWNSLLFTLGGPPLSESASTPHDARLDAELIPVTILSGFLGAGKTTLLCELLAETRLNVLAIVNDLAAVNIDAALVRSSTAETIALENGCACCVLGNDLDLVLSEVGCRDEKPDAIIIEASGVSDPMGIAQTVAGNPAVALDGVLTLVDAHTFDAQFVDPVCASLMQRQLAAAHLVLLTKTKTRIEPGDKSAMSALQQAVGKLAPGRAVLSVDDMQGRLEALVLGAGMSGARPDPGAQSHGYQQFTSTLIDFSTPLAADAFFALMEDIPESVYRIKGFLNLPNAGKVVRHEFQAVGSRWRVSKSDGNTPGAGQVGQLVVIGRAGSEQFDEFCATLQKLEN